MLPSPWQLMSPSRLVLTFHAKSLSFDMPGWNENVLCSSLLGLILYAALNPFRRLLQCRIPAPACAAAHSGCLVCCHLYLGPLWTSRPVFDAPRLHCARLQSRKSPAITVMRTRSRSLHNRLRHRSNSSTGTLGYNSRKWKLTLYIPVVNIKLFLLLVHLQFRTTFVRVIKCLYIGIDLYT